MSSKNGALVKRSSIVSQVSRQFVTIYAVIFISAFFIFIGFQLNAVNSDLHSAVRKSVANYGFVKFQDIKEQKQLDELEIISLVKNTSFVGVKLNLTDINPKLFFKKGYTITDRDLVKYSIKAPGNIEITFFASAFDIIKNNYDVFGFWFAVSILNTCLSYILLTRQVRTVIVEPVSSMLSKLSLGEGNINLLPKLRTGNIHKSVNELDLFINHYNNVADDFNSILGQQINKNSELTKQYSFYAKILDNISESIIIIDSNHFIKYANLSFCKFLQTSITTVVGGKIDIVLPELSNKRSWIENKISNHSSDIISNYELKTPVSKDPNIVDISFSPLNNSMNDYLISIRNVTEREINHKSETITEKMSYIHDFAMGIVSQLHKPIASVLSSVENIKLRFVKDSDNNINVAKDCVTEMSKVNNYYQRQSIPIFLRTIDEMGKKVLNYTNDILSINLNSKNNFDKFNLNNSVVEVIDSLSNELQERYNKIKKNTNQKFRITKFLDANLPAMILDRKELNKILYLSIEFLGSSLINIENSQDLEIEVITEFDRELRQHVIYIQDNGGTVDYDPNNIFMPYGKFNLREQPIGITMCLLYYLIVNKYSGDISFDSSYTNGLKLKIALPAGSVVKVENESIEAVSVV